jgi:hypothetical protein
LLACPAVALPEYPDPQDGADTPSHANALDDADDVILLRSSCVSPPSVNVKMTLVSWSSTLAERVNWAVGADEVLCVDQVLESKLKT